MDPDEELVALKSDPDNGELWIHLRDTLLETKINEIQIDYHVNETNDINDDEILEIQKYLNKIRHIMENGDSELFSEYVEFEAKLNDKLISAFKFRDIRFYLKKNIK